QGARGKEAAPMLKVVGTESAEDEVDGRSLLDEIAREGARRMLVAALETEVAEYWEAHRDERDGDGRALVVRNGKGRTRKITLGAGTITVSAPRVNDRRTAPDGAPRRASPRAASCHRTCAAPRRWPRCCPCSTCAGSLPAISARPWSLYSETMRAGCRPATSRGSPPSGRPSTAPSTSGA